MLSEAEQRRLIQIELSLRAEDPRFARRFEARAGGGSRGRRWRLMIVLLTVLVAVVGTIVGLAVGNTATVVIAVTVLGAGLGMLITRRRAH